MTWVVCVGLLILAFLCETTSGTAIAAEADYTQEAARAKVLLQHAVDYYKAKGDDAFPAFSRQGAFIDRELYVYVVDSNRVMLASGGPSVIWVGQKITNALSADLTKALEEALIIPEGKTHEAEYRWENRSNGKVQRKHAYFQRVGDRVLAVGYYMPRSNPEQAKVLLDKAVHDIEQVPDKTIQAINKFDPRYYQDDLYVFVVNMKNNLFIAHGYNSRLIGTNFESLLSADGKPIGQAILDTANSQGEGELEYLWKNPATERNEHKHTYFRKAGNKLIAVGYYSR